MTNTRFQVGQRVRTTVEFTSARGFPPEDAVPAGSAGTVDYVFTEYEAGYGVVFDCDRHKFSAYCKAEELEAED